MFALVSLLTVVVVVVVLLVVVVVVVALLVVVVVVAVLLVVVVVVGFVLVVVVVVPNGQLGGLWTKCMFFKKHCSRLGQTQVVKSTSIQKHIF